VLVFLIGSLPIVSAYFGIGNFEVPGTGPALDSDGDNIPDWWENLDWWNGTCIPNPAVNDSHLDFDGDGFTNLLEYFYGWNPCLSNNDGDGDGLPDAWEDGNGFNKFNENDGAADYDSDDLINYHEFLNDTDMIDPDTDDDTLPDGWEVGYGLDPLDSSDATLDNDTDSLSNLQEYARGTDPTDPDTDNDGVNDGSDTCPTDPLDGCADSDGDGIINEDDICPNTPGSEKGDIIEYPLSPWYGCGPGERDIDFDGVFDANDPCPDDASNSCDDSDGDGKLDYADPCPEDPLDACEDDDLDGVPDAIETPTCRNTPPGQTVNEFGCALSQIDSDGDDVKDNIDACPNTPLEYKNDVDSVGCVDKDTDGDLISDLYDQCPLYHNSSYPVDVFGCDIADLDFDGILDKYDPCPTNSSTLCGSKNVNSTGTVIDILVTGFANVTGSASVVESAIVGGFADITDNATVSGSANVSEYAEVKGNAKVKGEAKVSGNSVVKGNATVNGLAKVKESALIMDTAIVRGSAVISGLAVVSGNAKVNDSAEITGTAVVTGTTLVSGNSKINGASNVGGSSDISESNVSDALVYSSFIDPSRVEDSNVTWSSVRNCIVEGGTDLQYAQIEEIRIINNNVYQKDSATGKIRVENVNFTITSSSLNQTRDYREFVKGHTKSRDITINASGKTIKVNGMDTASKFAEVKIVTQSSPVVNVTVAKVAINTKGGTDYTGGRLGHYLIVEGDAEDTFSGLNLSNSVIKIYYNDSQVDGEGQPNESTLGIAYYNESTSSWKNESIVKIGKEANGTRKYVMANVDHFSIFTIIGDLIPCGGLEKWCEYENDGAGACIPLLDSCEPPSPPTPTGGGGPPAPKEKPIILPEAFQPNVIPLTSQLLFDLFIDRGLGDKSFWTVPNSVGASLVLTGEYPSPISPMVRGILAKPIKMLLEPLKFLRGERVESSQAIDDVYRFTTEKVLEKYTKSDTVVIAVRNPDVDSMAAVAYAKSIDAPILLTESGEAPELTLNAVRKLDPSKIVIVGGTVAISPVVESEFQKIAPTERIWGPTRYETAVELAERLDPVMVVITDGENPHPDAVIVAAEYKAPIIYISGSDIPESTRGFLTRHIKTKEGEKMTWITAGVDDDMHTEINGLYSLPGFLTGNRLSLKLFQFGTRFLR
jgi:carbonic anhydrase/acetyltransferase-like protein (isoleucine patch superfamily)